MNTADLIVLAVLALSVLFGLVRGFVAEVISLVCWVAAFWVAWLFGHDMARWYGQWLHDPMVQIVAGYMTCFLAVLMVGSLLGWGLRKLIRNGGLSGGDRFLGMLFGFARGVLLVVVVVWMLAFTPASAEPWWRQSSLLPEFAHGAGWLSDHLPPDVAQYMRSGQQMLHEGTQALPGIPGAPISISDVHLPKFPAAGSTAAPVPVADRKHGHAREGVGQ